MILKPVILTPVRASTVMAKLGVPTKRPSKDQQPIESSSKVKVANSRSERIKKQAANMLEKIGKTSSVQLQPRRSSVKSVAPPAPSSAEIKRVTRKSSQDSGPQQKPKQFDDKFVRREKQAIVSKNLKRVQKRKERISKAMTKSKNLC